ncbi:hypothetical protein VTI74DRAFT_3523 [Chaetomium olivicolor]
MIRNQPGCRITMTIAMPHHRGWMTSFSQFDMVSNAARLEMDGNYHQISNPRLRALLSLRASKTEDEAGDTPHISDRHTAPPGLVRLAYSRLHHGSGRRLQADIIASRFHLLFGPGLQVWGSLVLHPRRTCFECKSHNESMSSNHRTLHAARSTLRH